jgi:tryptophanyl-tRNA synthetase
MTRDMAGSFNQVYGRVFPLPESRLARAPPVPGTDGKKMSKSYGNTIEIFAEGSALKNSVMRIVTDSTPVEAPKDPEKDNLFALYSLFASDDEKEALAERYRAGGLGYGEVKKMLLGKIDAYFGPARARRKELEKHPSVVEAAPAKAPKARAEEGDRRDRPGLRQIRARVATLPALSIRVQQAEESRNFSKHRSFASLRMTEGRCLR